MRTLIARAMPRVVRRVNVICRYAGGLPDEPALPVGLRWDTATAELLDHVMTDDKRRRTALQQFLCMGAHGIVIHDGQRWAAHGFISPPGIGLPRQLPESITRDHWWFFYMHTHPDFRRRGLQKACSILKVRLIHKLGGKLNSTMTDTEVDNIPSRRCFARTGFQPAGVIRTVEIRLPKVGTHILHAQWNRDEVHESVGHQTAVK